MSKHVYVVEIKAFHGCTKNCKEHFERNPKQESTYRDWEIHKYWRNFSVCTFFSRHIFEKNLFISIMIDYYEESTRAHNNY